MTASSPDPDRPTTGRKRRLRAVFAADVANFSGRVSVSETHALGHLSTIIKIGREELERYEGVLICMPGDGLFALFESAVEAVHCALAIQERSAANDNLGGMRLRIGIHLGEVLFDGDIPFGETLNIAARLESLAEPGGILVSAAVVDAVSARIAATFEDRGIPRLKNIPRRIATFSIRPADTSPPTGNDELAEEALDHTMQFSRRSAAASTPAPTATPRAQTPADAPVMAASGGSGHATTDAVAPRPAAPALARPSANQPEGVAPLGVFAPEIIALVTEALAVHLGPVARVVVSRKSKGIGTVAELIDAIAAELASPDERVAFRSKLNRHLGHLGR